MAQWIVNTFMELASSFNEHSSQKQEEMIELSMTLFCEMLSWPFPSTNPNKYSKMWDP